MSLNNPQSTSVQQGTQQGEALREGGLAPPVRHPHAWQESQAVTAGAVAEYFSEDALNAEMERVFDVCHGCRRCLALCDSFPRLFDLIDESPSGELDTVDKKHYGEVADACTLCDMCFMASCPYVPPHEFNIDFPHLITRWRAAERKQKKPEPKGKALTQIDRNAALAKLAPWLANFGAHRSNKLGRFVLQKLFGVHPEAELPAFAHKRFVATAKKRLAQKSAPKTTDRKVVVYATCFVENHTTETGHAALALLAANGVEAVPVYPACCGMPRLERGDLKGVANQAAKVSQALLPWVEKGYEVVVLTPSCALMLKFEWPQLLPEDAGVKQLAAATYDVSEYLVALEKSGGLALRPEKLDGGIFLHVACHARAQNVGFKARDLLKLIPDTEIKFAARCSGHGGLWGSLEENFEIAHKVGKPVAQQLQRSEMQNFASECPLAGMHIVQGTERLAADSKGEKAPAASHPVVLFAKACGLRF